MRRTEMMLLAGIAVGIILMVIGAFMSFKPIEIDFIPEMTEREIREDYVTYFQENPKVKALSLDAFDEKLTNYFWAYIDQKETNGKISLLQPRRMTMLPDEHAKYAIAWIAHSIWVDKNKKVPWRLEDFSEQEIEFIFYDNIEDNKYHILNQDADYYTTVFDEYSLNYIPQESYEYAVTFIKNDRTQTVYAIMDDLRSDFVHGLITDDDGIARTVKQVLIEYKTMEIEYGTKQVRVSRGGCHTMSIVMVSLLRSINIPAYSTGQLGHAAIALPELGYIVHGDNLYYYIAPNAPSSELIIDWDTYNRDYKDNPQIMELNEAYIESLKEKYG